MLRRLAALDQPERGLLGRGMAWVIAARLGLRLLSFPRLQRLLDGLAAQRPLPFPSSPEKVHWAIAAAARRLPGTTCLAWSLACRGLLGQAGIPSDLRVGVARTPQGRFQAHAWVDCGGLTLSWGDDVAGYVALGSVAGRDP